jgi:hypothetical protein
MSCVVDFEDRPETLSKDRPDLGMSRVDIVTVLWDSRIEGD